MMLYITENEITVALNLRNIISIQEGIEGGAVIRTVDNDDYFFSIPHTKILERLKYSSATIEISGDDK